MKPKNTKKSCSANEQIPQPRQRGRLYTVPGHRSQTVLQQDGHKTTVRVHLKARRGVLLPLLQGGYRVSGHSPALTVVYLTREHGTAAEAAAHYHRLTHQPLPAAVLTPVPTTNQNE